MSRRFFLDANVLISGLLWKGSERKLLELGRKGVLKLVTSNHALREVQEFLEAEDFNKEKIDEALLYLRSICRIVYISAVEVQRCWDMLDDKKDVPTLVAALRSKATLVTGDKHLAVKGKRYLAVKSARAVLDERSK